MSKVWSWPYHHISYFSFLPALPRKQDCCSQPEFGDAMLEHNQISMTILLLWFFLFLMLWVGLEELSSKCAHVCLLSIPPRVPLLAEEGIMYKFARSGWSDECHQADRALQDNSIGGISSVNFWSPVGMFSKSCWNRFSKFPSPVVQNAFHTPLLWDLGILALPAGRSLSSSVILIPWWWDLHSHCKWCYLL